MARTTRSGGRSKASRRVRNPARRRPSSSACTCSDSTSSRGLESNRRTPCGRVAGATTRRAACSQPVAQRSASSRSASRCSRSSACSSAGSRTSSTVRSTERTARLSSMIRSASCSSKWSKASSSRLGRARALAALAGELDGGRDVVRLEQGASQRLQLREVVLAMAAWGATRLRIAEAALPGTQRVGAYPQELSCCVGPDTAHVASVSGESQKCSAITSHVRPTCWDVRATLQRFSVSERAT